MSTEAFTELRIVRLLGQSCVEDDAFVGVGRTAEDVAVGSFLIGETIRLVDRDGSFKHSELARSATADGAAEIELQPAA